MTKDLLERAHDDGVADASERRDRVDAFGPRALHRELCELCRGSALLESANGGRGKSLAPRHSPPPLVRRQCLNVSRIVALSFGCFFWKSLPRVMTRPTAPAANRCASRRAFARA